jgi:glycosyltransferase involved in cell wall biosynthesis
MLSVLHIVPGMSVGGVETGIYRSYEELNHQFRYEVFSLKGAGTVQTPVLGPRAFVERLINRDLRPDVVVTSLWPSHPLGFVFQTRGSVWLPFFHSSSFSHRRDSWVSTWAARASSMQICDSNATAKFLGRTDDACVICPYVFAPPKEREASLMREFTYVFCGRLAEVKRPDLMEQFISVATAGHPTATALFILAGSEEEIQLFQMRISKLNASCRVVANARPESVQALLRTADFYVSVSDYEGSSASTIEAISAGCIPIVRPVGEISRYVPPEVGVYIEDTSLKGMHHAIAAARVISSDPNELVRRSEILKDVAIGMERYVPSFSRAIYTAVSRQSVAQRQRMRW